jgi:hypothetical protein
LAPNWAHALPDAAQGHAAFWALAVYRQHQRLKNDADEYGEAGRLLDAMQYVICLRNVIRSAHLVHDAVQPYDAGYVDYWLRNLQRYAPGVVAARNLLEHFDEYALGLGRVRRGRSRTPLRVKLDRTGEGRLKLVLVASGRRVAIDLDKATDAAAHLWIGLVSVADAAEEMAAEEAEAQANRHRRPQIVSRMVNLGEDFA